MNKYDAAHLANIASWATRMNALCAQLDAGEITEDEFKKALAEEGEPDD